MARTIRTACTIADVQTRMARVGRIERLDERKHIAQSFAEAEPLVTMSLASDNAGSHTFGPEFAHSPFAHLANVMAIHDTLIAAEAERDAVIAMGQRYEYERSCAEHTAHGPSVVIEMVTPKRADFVLVNG